ncbi:MAG TPA: VOC family protein [Patescibacteria group bacterium]|nr:VOC family protein [Patescibacteria group bacterium]
MAQLNPYVNFPGNTEEAFNFYKSVFGGEFIGIMRYKDTPEADRISATEQDKIMHIALYVGSNILMGTDMLESMGQKAEFGNNMSLNYGADTEEEAREIFKKLSDGGTVSIPMEKQFWGDLFGMTTDKFGIQWMVSHMQQAPQQA